MMTKLQVPDAIIEKAKIIFDVIETNDYEDCDNDWYYIEDDWELNIWYSDDKDCLVADIYKIVNGDVIVSSCHNLFPVEK